MQKRLGTIVGLKDGVTQWKRLQIVKETLVLLVEL
jgi:hypothetical protein